jgi:glycine C-acetyltransferase
VPLRLVGSEMCIRDRIYPVVPKDVIMLRIIPTAAHTLEDVNYTVETFIKLKEKLDAGAYQADELAAVEIDKKR